MAFDVDRVCGEIEARRRDHPGVFVVAVDGQSAAGKSTFAAHLAERLDAALLHMDDFYRDMPEVERLRLSPQEGVDRYFDWQRFRGEALEPLRRAQPARFRCFDWDSGSGLTNPTAVDPSPVVVVEGVYSARPELDDLVDLKVLVKAPLKERRRRRRQRHDPHEWEERWERTELHYFEHIATASHFDLVVASHPG